MNSNVFDRFYNVKELETMTIKTEQVSIQWNVMLQVKMVDNGIC